MNLRVSADLTLHWRLFKIGVGKEFCERGTWRAFGVLFRELDTRVCSSCKSSLSRMLICTYDLCIYLYVCMLYSDKKLTKSNSRVVVDMSPYAFLVPEVEQEAVCWGSLRSHLCLLS